MTIRYQVLLLSVEADEVLRILRHFVDQWLSYNIDETRDKNDNLTQYMTQKQYLYVRDKANVMCRKQIHAKLMMA